MKRKIRGRVTSYDQPTTEPFIHCRSISTTRAQVNENCTQVTLELVIGHLARESNGEEMPFDCFELSVRGKNRIK